MDRELAGRPPGPRRWYVTARQEHTLAVVPGPARFTAGSPEHEPDRRPDEKPHRRHLPRSFAVATKEVRVRQFPEFLKVNPGADRHRPDVEPDDGPVRGVTWFAAAQYCRWLSEQGGVREGECCYLAVHEIKD